VAVGLVRGDRGPVRFAGSGALVAASWSRLISQDVSTVEWYTMPAALVLCAIGVWRVQTRADASTVLSLSPGLILLLIPSLGAALPDPASLRGLLLGCGSLAILLAGAYLRWAAPLVVASVTLLALAVVSIAPYANAIPRWVLFGLAGGLLLFLGVTWERRLRNARTLIMAVELLR
jgi:cell division protein FtsW (lipid II flippase)